MKLKLIIYFTFILTTTKIFAAGETGEVLKDTAKGAVVGGVVGAAQTEIGKKVIGEAGLSKVGEFFDSPQGIALMAGISTIYSNTLYSAASDQEKDAKTNILKVEKLIQSYKDSWQGFCPNGREKIEESSCYCYLDSGKVNPNRTNSAICQALWAQNNSAYVTASKSYANSIGLNDPVGCVGLNGAFDENCRCKKLVNSKGQNACKKSANVSLSNVFAPAILTNTGLRDVMSLAANSANGTPNFQNFDSGSLGMKAIATENFLQSMLSKIASKTKGTSPLIIDESNVNQIAGKILGGSHNLAKIVASSSPSAAFNSAPQMNPKSNQILQDLKKKNSLDFFEGGKGLEKKADEKKSGFDLNFSDTGGNGAGSAQTLDNFPEKIYKYTNSDITTNDSVSIFEIISNRYIQSGLKRLFDEGEIK